MKETRKFFDNNGLNKGYSNKNNKSNNHLLSKHKNKNLLPPIDILEQYEELYPGITAKLVAMAQKEQNHRQATEVLAIEKRNQMLKLNKVFAIILIMIISITTLLLATYNDLLIAMIFSASAFISIAISSCSDIKSWVKISSDKSYNNKPMQSQRNFVHKRKNRK